MGKDNNKQGAKNSQDQAKMGDSQSVQLKQENCIVGNISVGSSGNSHPFVIPKTFVAEMNNVTIKYSSGQVYTGDLLYGLPNGKGRLIMPEGNNHMCSPYTYDGHFKNGLFDGEGEVAFKNGDKLKCTFKDDQIIVCTYTYKDGCECTGSLDENSQFNGKGSIKVEGPKILGLISTDKEYKGTWEKNMFTSEDGRSHYDVTGRSNGSTTSLPNQFKIRLSSIQDSEQGRKGSITDKYGYQFIGTFDSNNQLHGEGEIKYDMTAIQKGQFEHGKLIEGVYVDLFGNSIEVSPASPLEFPLKGDYVFTCCNGDKYHGSFSKNLMEGFGRMNYANKTMYDGEWKNGKRAGMGKFIYGEEEGYNGEWKEDQRNGQGMSITKDSVYHGEWKNDKKEGKGMMAYKNGDIYEGEWKNDKKEGKGTMTSQNGDRYNGEWKNDKKEGKGMMTYKNGDIYEGEWKNDKREGKGEVTYPSGYKLIGNWKNDKRDGYVQYEDPNKKHFEYSENKYFINYDQEKHNVVDKNFKGYSGCLVFKDNKYIKEGYGVMTYENNDMYNGNWKNNLPSGKGTYIFGNKDQFNGMFENGEFKEGTMSGIHPTNKSRFTYKGKFEHNKMCDQDCSLEDNNGAIIYKGAIRDNELVGNGILAWHDTHSKNQYKGEFQHNRFHGHGELSWEQGDQQFVYVGEFVNGLAEGNGVITITTKDSKETFEGRFSGGKQEGNGTYTCDTGKKKNSFTISGSYKQGKKCGNFTYTEGDREYTIKFNEEGKEESIHEKVNDKKVKGNIRITSRMDMPKEPAMEGLSQMKKNVPSSNQPTSQPPYPFPVTQDWDHKPFTNSSHPMNRSIPPNLQQNSLMYANGQQSSHQYSPTYTNSQQQQYLPQNPLMYANSQIPPTNFFGQPQNQQQHPFHQNSNFRYY